MIDDVESEHKEKIAKSVELFRKDLSRIRTGRANLAMLESVRVSYYGSKVPLNQVGTVSIPDARLIVIKPWDKSVLQEIEKAVNVAEIGLTPQNDGEVVRLPVPALTEERRRDLAKQIKRMTEDARVKVRNLRRDSNDFLKELEKNSDISEDDLKRGLDRIQKITDEAIKQLDSIASDKEREIMEV